MDQFTIFSLRHFLFLLTAILYLLTGQHASGQQELERQAASAEVKQGVLVDISLPITSRTASTVIEQDIRRLMSDACDLGVLSGVFGLVGYEVFVGVAARHRWRADTVTACLAADHR